MDGIPGMESTMLRVSEAAIRAGSAFYETAAAAGEASARADGLAASAAAAADAATAPLKSLQALRDAVAGSGRRRGARRRAALAGPAARAGCSAASTRRSAPPRRRRVARLRPSTRSRTRPPSSPQRCRANVAQGLGSLFAGLITGATSLKEAIGSVIARLGELALTRGFETLLAGVGFGTGPLGQLASLFLAPTARAAGGPVMAGRPISSASADPSSSCRARPAG